MIWYPYQQMKTMKAPFQIVDAQGVYLRTPEREMIDSVSSWWSVIHGYKHPTLTRAIQDQAGKFCHVMLGGLTHEPVQKLSAKLEQWLPGDLDCCFFSDSGSVAVEVSLKMALQYYMNRGEPHQGAGAGARLPRRYVQGHGGGRRRGLSLRAGSLWRKNRCDPHSHPH